jgi:hypothetical protein
MTAVWITAGAGLVLLVVLLLVVLSAVRRFTRVADAYRAEIERGRAGIVAAVPPRWAGEHPSTAGRTPGERL